MLEQQLQRLLRTQLSNKSLKELCLFLRMLNRHQQYWEFIPKETVQRLNRKITRVEQMIEAQERRAFNAEAFEHII